MTDVRRSSMSTSDCDEDDEFSAGNSDSWDEEDDNSDSEDSEETEDLEQFNVRFRAAVDNKVRIAETFCDHKHYVFSFATHSQQEPGIEDKEEQQTQHDTPEQYDSAEFRMSPPRTTEVTIDLARDEIAELRTAREIFVSHKTEVKQRLKQTESDEDARWLYECEEVIEAIDTIIDYKNEVICGKESSPPQLFPEKDHEETKQLIMTRLANLSSDEQLRLLCKFFTKVVELRHSSKQLEKSSDHLLAENEDILKYLKHYKKKMKKQEEAYSDHVKLLTVNHGSAGHHNEDSRNNRYHPRDDHHRPSSSHRHRQNNNGGLLDSLRDHQRHYPSGPEITRHSGKIRIHNQNSH